MKQDPHSADILQRMAPGVLSRSGFLGHDPRPLEEILDADRSAVVGLGTTHEAIAARLREVYDKAQEALGSVVQLRGVLTAFHREAMGRIPCPFGGCGTFHKGQIEVTDTRTGETIVFTPLSIHLIESHGFYQGRGSSYRLEPATLCRLLP